MKQLYCVEPGVCACVCDLPMNSYESGVTILWVKIGDTLLTLNRLCQLCARVDCFCSCTMQQQGNIVIHDHPDSQGLFKCFFLYRRQIMIVSLLVVFISVTLLETDAHL